jgi:hypothetical protein
VDVVGVEELGADVDLVPVALDRRHASTGPVERLQDLDLIASPTQPVARGEPADPGSYDDHLPVLHY